MTRFADTLVPRRDSWSAMRAAFEWPQLDRFNMASACVERWARQDPERTALICLKDSGAATRVTFQQLDRLANRFANVLTAGGAERGDRCAILLQQSLETALCHFGIYKTAGVALPLFTLFGADALEFRLRDSGARVVVTDSANLPKLLEVRDRLPDLETIYCIDGAGPDVRDFHADLNAASDSFRTLATSPDDPALLVYTSGTTGPPKGALHGHRVLIGHLPCIETAHNFFPIKGDLHWTPADWAWMGGLMNTLMPSLYYGVPVVAYRMGKFDPEKVYDVIAAHSIRNAFLPPTALKLMRQVPAPGATTLRSVLSGGEALGADILDWGRKGLGLTINEIYGQTECNLVLGNCVRSFDPRPDSMGQAVPGAEVVILGPDGIPLEDGETGEIAIHHSHKAMFLKYWNAPEKTAAKFSGEWMRTGDIGTRDENGFFAFSSRDDDVITSAGYRVGPSEIESCLGGHKDVVFAGVIGVPDDIRGEVVKAFIVLREGVSPEGMEQALIERVKQKVSPHVAPRSVRFLTEMPMTATSKIMRRELRALDG
ncbi:AMP-binding protein [Neptunicoccus cionae]|uniref:AMP-dependent synthetase n=1 Tax=Neptunicoccus cionae TaxID=2035344 RepID=A0A916R1F0_9RHOB|nr:AMP-binding protein [Amylibacter cionae]GGA24445.1 AMP-dependent synthetase [Amylibacter cionae]